MKNLKLFKASIIPLVILLTPGIVRSQNLTFPEVPLDYIPVIDETKTFTDADGNIYTFRFRTKDGNRNGNNMFETSATKNGERIHYKDWNYALNGSPHRIGWGREILNFDENGNFLSNLGYSGTAASNNIVTTDFGKILDYDLQGNLKGAYNDILEYMAQRFIKNDGLSFDLRDSDGNFYEKDSHGNITDAYYQNGTKSPHMNYTYDAGGNVIKAYQNGKEVYSRKRYTIPEADAATQGKGPFRLDITW